MNKKILLGSIIAVVILVLVSFTGVVGYQTTKSSTIAKASPLFTVRTQRAIDKERKDLTCDYVGKGEEITIPLPILENRNLLMQKFLDIIRKISKSEMNRIIDFIQRHCYDAKLKDTNIQNLLINPKEAMDEIAKEDKFDFTSKETCPWTLSGWFRGCLLLLLWIAIWVAIFGTGIAIGTFIVAILLLLGIEIPPSVLGCDTFASYTCYTCNQIFIDVK